ncbi:MAG: hypothetical protein JXB07_03530 [Anaerolineae bacterium]|nr:hypothetical protein [Anaerolineae bacterium]
MIAQHKIVWLIVGILTISISHTALADTGPKPTMEFTFTQAFSGPEVTILSGIMYECNERDCSDAVPLGKAGPQHFECDGIASCDSLAYDYKNYHRLDIQFSDGKARQSNIFRTAGFRSKYKVLIQPDDLLVKPQMSLAYFLPILIAVVICSCLLSVAVVVRRFLKKR